MMPAIRRARQDDESAIARIAFAAFGENIRGYADCLDSGVILSAKLDGVVVGFAACFCTKSAAGEKRFELDLLAVDEKARGRGVATALTRRCIKEARACGADLIRALVRCDNIGMARACESAGLLRMPGMQTLFVLAAKAPEMSVDSAHVAYLVPVDTLTYRGVWIEGGLSQAAIDAANRLAHEESRARIGAVAPVSDGASIQILRRNGFARAGEFDWWHIAPTTNPDWQRTSPA